MERVGAAMHGWALAPYDNKADTDANCCLDWVLRLNDSSACESGLPATTCSTWRGRSVWRSARCHQPGQFEMLQGMAEAQARAIAEAVGADRPLLYTPAVDREDFDVAIGYLFRRLEETAAPNNFLRALFSLEPESPTFASEAARFTASVVERHRPSCGSRRTHDRSCRLHGRSGRSTVSQRTRD